MSLKINNLEKINKWLIFFSGKEDIALAIVLLVAIIMMILPLPIFMVDFLIAINITFSIILLLIAIYLTDPLDLSVFPSLLLITTLYRLSLTVSTSRLVLLQHDAGNIVSAFGHFVVGGNLTVGLVIFTIITIVQFIVITKGAERVAEVSARFSLDGLPGKQMSIDSDMRAGVIDASQAREQRQHVQQESRFLGSMDGAMKFVKGDAIAGIIVVLINIIGGVIIAIAQYGMSLEEAIKTYSVLSIGDGLCGQIPSLLISLSAGIIVTRVPGEKKQNLADELAMQIGRQPRAMMLTAIILLFFSVIPGFPFLVFFLLALPFAFIYWRFRNQGSSSTTLAHQTSEGKTEMSPGAYPLTLLVTPRLHTAALTREIESIRLELFNDYGVPLPDIVLEEKKCTSETESIDILLYLENVFTLALPGNMPVLIEGEEASLNGDEVILPDGLGKVTFLSIDMGEKAKSLGFKVYTGNQRIARIFKRLLTRYMHEFIGVQEARYLMDAMESRYSELVKELQRQLPIGKIAEVLQRLVSERVSVRDLRMIFGTLIEWAPREKDTLMLTEYVRISLRRHILHRLSPDGEPLRIIRIGDSIENLIRESVRQTAMGTYAALSVEQNSRILMLIEEAVNQSPDSCVVSSIDTRRFLRKILESKLFNISVLSWQELGDKCLINIVQNIDIAAEELATEENDEY